MKQLVNKNSKGPYITFRAIDIMNESLRTHIHRAPYSDISKSIIGFNGKSEVCKFEGIVSEKDVRGFDISVDDSLRCQVVEGLKDRQYNLMKSVSREIILALDKLVEVPSFAKLCDNVAVIDAEVDVLTFDDVRMADLPQDGHLTFQESSGYFTFDIIRSHLLYCDRLLRQYVSSLVYSAETSFPYLLLQVENVVLDLF